MREVQSDERRKYARGRHEVIDAFGASESQEFGRSDAGAVTPGMRNGKAEIRPGDSEKRVVEQGKRDKNRNTQGPPDRRLRAGLNVEHGLSRKIVRMRAGVKRLLAERAKALFLRHLRESCPAAAFAALTSGRGADTHRSCSASLAAAGGRHRDRPCLPEPTLHGACGAECRGLRRRER